MIDDEQELREPRTYRVAEPEGRSNIDGLAAFTTNKPAVTVAVKRRRGTAELRSDHDGVQVVRVPRVYQVRTSASPPIRPQPAVTVERDNNRQAGALDLNAVVETSPARRRRARRDPTHAPGAVTRTVFEASPPMPVAREAESETGRREFIVKEEVGYEQVMAALQQVRANLDLALSARRFRIE